jgi:thioredoxin-dependent peroxiredoxin
MPLELAPEMPAPRFSLPRDGGGNISLDEFAGRKLVLYFYPKADTPGCTLESQAFSALRNSFDKAGAAVVGVSADPIKAQDAFKKKYGLDIPLASDETRQMIQDYGVWVEKSMYGRKYMGIERTTFLIDPHGRIARIWRKVKVKGHADEVLLAAEAF